MNEKLHILQHSLGVDKYGEGAQHRNHFVTGPGSADYSICQGLVQLGLMRIRSMSKALTGGDDCFVVTPQGVDYVALNSPAKPPEPKLTRSKKNYRDYLRSECSESFRDWMGFPRKLPNNEIQHRQGFAR